jgi:cytochrome c-type biogenesis protein CcmH/NrfF
MEPRDLHSKPLQFAKTWVPQVWIFRPGKARILSGRGIPFSLKAAEALLLAVSVVFSVGASDSSSRLDHLSHQLMCMCGCSQVLGECDHAGCPDRDKELADLSAEISAGDTDQQILSSFAAKYGAVVLAAPTTHGFDLVAWIAPIAVFAAALLGTILLVRQWSIGRTQTAPQPSNPEIDALREKIRRETGSDDVGGN